MLNTVVRQIAFYHLRAQGAFDAAQGRTDQPKQLGQYWLEVQRESLGPAVRLGPGYETYWTYIGHFIHSPFYVYAYAFGDCLVNSLYAVYEKSADGFAARYLDLLAAGGRKHHSELLEALRTRRARSGVLGQGPLGHRADDRGTRGAGGLSRFPCEVTAAVQCCTICITSETRR